MTTTTATTTATPLPAGVTPGTWEIETSHSGASFRVRHAGISKVRGTIDITGGEIVLGDTLEASTVRATLDPATVDTKDERRDGHLRSAEFFETETYPVWEFRSTTIRPEGTNVIIEGELTAHGVTRPVHLRTETASNKHTDRAMANTVSQAVKRRLPRLARARRKRYIVKSPPVGWRG